MIEYREETCDECGTSRDREWVIRNITHNSPTPTGWTTETRTGFWKTITAPTHWTSLCDCDTA